jgi:hypothetical protein
LVQRLDGRETRGLGQQNAAALLPLAELGLKQSFEELLVAPFSADRLFGNVRQLRRHRAQGESLAEIVDALKVDHMAISSAANS